MNPDLLINGIRSGAAERQAAELSSQQTELEEEQKTQAQFDSITKAIKSLESTIKTQKPDNSTVIAAIGILNTTLKQLPGAIKIPAAPEPLESVAVTNLDEIKLETKDVVAAIQALKLDPKINVAAPNVHVDAPDLSSLTKAQKAVVEAIKSIPQPEKVDNKDVIKAVQSVHDAIKGLRFPVPTVATDPLIAYTPADIDDATTIQYFGFTQNGGAWYIRKYDTSVSPKTLRFAFGQSGYSAAWAARAGQTYTIWGT